MKKSYLLVGVTSFILLQIFIAYSGAERRSSEEKENQFQRKFDSEQRELDRALKERTHQRELEEVD